jgi:hypothetical protein
VAHEHLSAATALDSLRRDVGGAAGPAIFRGAMWNQTIPDALRGRLAGIELLSYSVGPQVGQVRSGGVAAWWGVRASVWSGGLLCAGALLAVCLPGLVAYDVRTNEHAVRLREQRVTAPRSAA